MDLLKAVLFGRWAENDYPIPLWQRPLYRLKALYCMIFAQVYGPLEWTNDQWGQNSIAVCYTDGGKQPGSVHGPLVYWGEQLRVGLGLRQNCWCYFDYVSSD